MQITIWFCVDADADASPRHCMELYTFIVCSSSSIHSFIRCSFSLTVAHALKINTNANRTKSLCAWALGCECTHSGTTDRQIAYCWLASPLFHGFAHNNNRIWFCCTKHKWSWFFLHIWKWKRTQWSTSANVVFKKMEEDIVFHISRKSSFQILQLKT